jgi:hypothetical protein
VSLSTSSLPLFLPSALLLFYLISIGLGSPPLYPGARPAPLGGRAWLYSDGTEDPRGSSNEHIGEIQVANLKQQQETTMYMYTKEE